MDIKDVPLMTGEDPNNRGYARPVYPKTIGLHIGNDNIQRLLKYQETHGLTWEEVEQILIKWVVEKLDTLT